MIQEKSLSFPHSLLYFLLRDRKNKMVACPGIFYVQGYSKLENMYEVDKILSIDVI